MSMLDDFVEQSAGPSSGAARSSDAYRRSNGGGAGATVVGPDFDDVEYEGFEVDDEDEPDEDLGMVRALETGFIPSSRLQTTLPPLFSLSLVQYTPPSSILSLVTANNLLVLASHPLSIVIINLNKPDELVTVDLPKPAPEKGNVASTISPVIQKMFIDPAARHLLITTDSGDTFYLPISPGNAAVQSRRPRPLRLRQTITAVAWSPYSGPSAESTGTADGQAAAKTDVITPPSTDVLLGTTSGQILSLPLPPQDDIFKSVSISMSKTLERDLQTVYAVPDQQPITGVAFGFWSETERKGKRKAWVVITTKERVYEVQGNVSTTSTGGKTGGWAEELFKAVRDSALKFQELPGDPPSSELRIYASSAENGSSSRLGPPSSLAWITGPGLYTSPLSSTPVPEILVKPSLLPYPPSSTSSAPVFSRTASPGITNASIPISAVITQYHHLLLYPDRIIGISREEEKVIWEENLPLGGNERAIGLSSDPIGQTFWIYTDKSILEVLIRVEDRDVWRAKLGKGEFTEALTFARTKAQKDVVLSRQGDSLFEQGRFIQSAQAFAKCSRSFEYVTLKFIDVEERDALRIYLSDRLDLLDKRDRTQRMMLATWLIEIYLSKCNDLEDIVAAESAVSDVESLSVERQIMEEDIRNFMTTYQVGGMAPHEKIVISAWLHADITQNDLDAKVVYELILSHGREDLYLFYAGLMRDHGKVVEHWVTEEQWGRAIDILNRQDSLDLYYRFASVLMQNSPKATVDSWMLRRELSPKRLIPALLQRPTQPKTTSVNDHAIRYLTHVVFQQQSTDTIIHNLLLTLHATSGEDDGALLKFLSSSVDDPLTERPYYDLDYALRVCKAHGRTQACVHIYSKMGMYESSVDLALQKGDLELAKINADRPEDDDVLRRKLWLKIAKYVVQEQKDVKSAMRFLEATDLLKIEDIMPFFPDFVVIDDFKDEICTALEQYAARIDELRAEMDQATQSAESIKRDIAALSNRFVTVETGDKCWRCGLGLQTRQFYVFPCQHTFHADCMISMAMEFLPAPTLRRILHLRNELVKQEPAPRVLLSQTFPSTPGNSTPNPRGKGRDPLPSSGNAATDLLLGVTGRNKLFAASDKLRDLIIPDALAQAVTAVGTTVVSGVSAVGGIAGAAASGTGQEKKKSKKERDQEDARILAARKELDDLVAGVCPLCEGVVIGLDRPFIKEDEDVGDWAI